MRRLTKLLFVALLAVAGLAACSEKRTAGCTIESRITLPGYSKAYLVNVKKALADSTAIHDGSFRFELTDSIAEPYIAVMHIVGSRESDRMVMPVAIENGTVKISLGEYVRISGTPLNNGIQTFLDGMQLTKDGMLQQDSISSEEIRETSSAFFRQEILGNRGNALAGYILENYGHNLTESDRAQVEAALGN